MSSSRECKKFPALPVTALHSASVAVQGMPIVCGGKKPDNNQIYTCYINEGAPNYAWRRLTDHIMQRHMHAAVVVGNRVWLTGGVAVVVISMFQSQTTAVDRTEFVSMDGTVERGPNLPHYMQNHCMVELNDGRVMILGGNRTIRTSLWKDNGAEYHHSTNEVLIYQPDTMNFTNGPSMRYNRSSLACAHFYSHMHEGRPVALAVGGKQGTAEVLDYTQENAEWQESKSVLD